MKEELYSFHILPMRNRVSLCFPINEKMKEATYFHCSMSHFCTNSPVSFEEQRMRIHIFYPSFSIAHWYKYSKRMYENKIKFILSEKVQAGLGRVGEYIYL